MTTITAIVLGLSIFTTGLFSGLMFALVALLHPKWRAQDAAEYITDIQPFLKVGKGNLYVSLVLFTGLIAPILALLIGGDDLSATAKALLVIGFAFFLLGPLMITVVFNLPTYTKLMALDPAAPAADWQALRRRFHMLNFSRFATSSVAFTCFILALMVML